MFVHCTKRKKENRQKNQQIQLKFDHTAYQIFFEVSKRRKLRFGKMYKLLGVTQSKLRTYGNGNHLNYLGDDHLIYEGGGLEAGKFCRVRIFIFNFLRARNYIFAYFRTYYSFPAIPMLNLEVRPDHFFIFLGTQARLFIFKFLAARISISKNCRPPPPQSPNQMVVPLVHIALNANMTCEATPN